MDTEFAENPHHEGTVCLQTVSAQASAPGSTKSPAPGPGLPSLIDAVNEAISGGPSPASAPVTQISPPVTSPTSDLDKEFGF